MMNHELFSINVKFLYLALTLYFNEKCKPHFWVKAISLVANFGSTRSALTSIDHKQRIKKSNFLNLRPPPPLALNALKRTKKSQRTFPEKVTHEPTMNVRVFRLSQPYNHMCYVCNFIHKLMYIFMFMSDINQTELYKLPEAISNYFRYSGKGFLSFKMHIEFVLVFIAF